MEAVTARPLSEGIREEKNLIHTPPSRVSVEFWHVSSCTHMCMWCKFSGDGGGGGGGDGGDGGGGSGGEECAQERDVYRKGEIEKNKFLGSGGDGGGGSRGDGGRLVGDEVVMIVVTSK